MTGPKKVLIVDDEEVFCLTLSEFFRDAGYETRYALNGDDALDMIRADAPDLMTLDIRMPGKNAMLMQNSMAALEEAKKIKKDLRVIIISAIDFGEDADFFKAAGADVLYRKPVDLEELLETVKRLIGDN